MQDLQNINIDDIVEKIVPLTVLRRYPGRIFKDLRETGGFIITKDGRPVGKLLPLRSTKKQMTKEEKLKKLKSLIGGFSLKINLSPMQLNKIIEQSYEKMLS